MALILYFISSFVVNSLYLGVFDHFSTLFDRQINKHTEEKVSKDTLKTYPTLLIFFVSSSMMKSLCSKLFVIFLTDLDTRS